MSTLIAATLLASVLPVRNPWLALTAAALLLFGWRDQLLVPVIHHACVPLFPTIDYSSSMYLLVQEASHFDLSLVIVRLARHEASPAFEGLDRLPYGLTPSRAEEPCGIIGSFLLSLHLPVEHLAVELLRFCHLLLRRDYHSRGTREEFSIVKLSSVCLFGEVSLFRVLQGVEQGGLTEDEGHLLF